MNEIAKLMLASLIMNGVGLIFLCSSLPKEGYARTFFQFFIFICLCFIIFSIINYQIYYNKDDNIFYGINIGGIVNGTVTFLFSIGFYFYNKINNRINNKSNKKKNKLTNGPTNEPTNRQTNEPIINLTKEPKIKPIIKLTIEPTNEQNTKPKPKKKKKTVTWGKQNGGPLKNVSDI